MFSQQARAETGSIRGLNAAPKQSQRDLWRESFSQLSRTALHTAVRPKVKQVHYIHAVLEHKQPNLREGGEVGEPLQLTQVPDSWLQPFTALTGKQSKDAPSLQITAQDYGTPSLFPIIIFLRCSRLTYGWKTHWIRDCLSFALGDSFSDADSKSD